MSDDRPLSGLLDLNEPDKGTGDVFSVSAYNTLIREFENRVNGIIQAAKDRESNYAGSSNPTDNTKRGKIYANYPANGRVRLKVDPDGSGADDEILTAAEAYTVDMQADSAASATGRPSGVLNVRTDQVEIDDDGETYSYTIPANTLNVDGAVIRSIIVQSVDDNTVNDPFFGGTTLSIFAGGVPSIYKTWIVRTATGQQKMCAAGLGKQDAAGGSLLSIGNPTEDETQGIASGFIVPSGGGSPGEPDTFEMGIWEFF